jgi:hypothetical protein
MSTNQGGSQSQTTEFMVRCPQCGKPSNAIKIFTFPIIIWLIVFFYFFRRTVAACPACQRQNIGFYASINLPAMHLLWPIVYLPLIVYYFVRTLIPGHSNDVHEYLQLRK